MKFTTYADVYTPDHPNARRGSHGLLLKDVLERNGGRYETDVELPLKFRNHLRQLAELTSDPKLAELAETPSVKVSLEHLRHYDPNTTRIFIGSRVEREPSDGPLPGIDR